MERNRSKTILTFFLLWLSAAAFLCLSFSITIAATEDRQFFRLPLLVALSGVLLFSWRKHLSLSYLTHIEREDLPYYVIGSLIIFAVFFPFYRSFSGLILPKKIVDMIPCTTGTLAFFFGILGSVVGYPIVVYATKYLCKDYLGINSVSFTRYRFLSKPFLIMSTLYCSSILTILRANYIYKDDMQRVSSGVTLYHRENRFLAEFFLSGLEGSTFYADLSPLTQILEMCLMAAAVVIVYFVLTGKKEFHLMDYIAMIPFGVSPYFLEGISFKYDPPQHGMAVFFAVLPLLLWQSTRKKYILVTSLCTVALCASHQVPMAVFPTMVILLCLLKWNSKSMSNRELLLFIRDSIIGYFAGLLFFKFALMHKIYYNTGLSGIWPLKELIPGMVQNYRTFFDQILSDFHPLWLVLIAVILLTTYLALAGASQQRRGKAALVNLAGFLLLLLLSNSLYPILSAPLHSPRHMYSFGLLIGILVIAAIYLCRGSGVVAKTAATLLALSFFTFSVKYGNALSCQADYTRFRVENVLDALAELPVFQTSDGVITQIIGTTGYAPSVAAMKDPMIERLVTTSFNEYYGTWYASDLYNLYGLNAYYYPDTHPDLRELDLPLIKDTYYYSLYADDNYVLISLKERSDVEWLLH